MLTDVSGGSAGTTNKKVSSQVIEAVADRTGLTPVELPPLHETIDTEALNTLFRKSDPSDSRAMTFTYYDFEITVSGANRITVSEIK